MNNKILTSLLKAKGSFESKENLNELSINLKSSFLADWSETPDNIETSKFLNYGHVKNKDIGQLEQGLILKSKNELISNILYAAFGESEVPNEVVRNYPNLTKEEWKQIIRVTQIVVSSFECEK